MTVTMPTSVGIAFAHASLQFLAEQEGVDLLHIKGPAIDDELLRFGPSLLEGQVSRPVPRESVDADVLVRPSHLGVLFAAMHRHGWSTAYRFEDGSPFEHAATMRHPFLAPVDLHRRFPGIGMDAGTAFDRLWESRRNRVIAGYPCCVPDVTSQRLILLLHAARAGVRTHPDVETCWDKAGEAARIDVMALAADLHAEVALAAATGRLSHFRDRREHDLWAALSSGETSMARLWIARVRAEPSRRAAIRVGTRLLVPKIGRLEAGLGRPPTRAEVAHAWVDRVRLAVSQVGRAIRGHGRRLS